MTVPGVEVELSWSPDSRKFLFTKIPFIMAPSHIYIMNRDGSGLVQLTTEGQNRDAAWRPH